MSQDSWSAVCSLRKWRRDRLTSYHNLKESLHRELTSVAESFPDLISQLPSVKVQHLSSVQYTEPLDVNLELDLLRYLSGDHITAPISAETVCKEFLTNLDVEIPQDLHSRVCCTLEKFKCENLIDFDLETQMITFLNYFTLREVSQYRDENSDNCRARIEPPSRKRKLTEIFTDIPSKQSHNAYKNYWKEKAQELISFKSFKERQHAETAQQIHDLISMPTAKDRMHVEKFKCQEPRIIEFCKYLTRGDCIFNMKKNRYQSNLKSKLEYCTKLHYRPVNSNSTERKLGDCSFLNTCFHMETCKYVHYELDLSGDSLKQFLEIDAKNVARSALDTSLVLYPPQWIQCDVRSFDMTCLGKFSVIMADPPWDIHMELPYGTMSDREMVGLPIPDLQDEGFIFLWVTGRAMEVGRECLKDWGYTRCEDLIWVKINQLGKLIRTGRTGHWINHGKEHCLVGIKGNPAGHTACLDTDVLISEVRETSHKPDEIYGLLERLSPGTRKLELFGRMHNTRPNWITLGNQTDGVRLLDPKVIRAFRKIYPDANALKPRKQSQKN